MKAFMLVDVNALLTMMADFVLLSNPKLVDSETFLLLFRKLMITPLSNAQSSTALIYSLQSCVSSLLKGSSFINQILLF